MLYYAVVIFLLLSVLSYWQQQQQPKENIETYLNNIRGGEGNNKQAFCLNITRNEIEQHLSTKTPYRVVANRNDTPLHYPGCQPTRIWSVNRHGTRNPSKLVILDAKEKLTEIKFKILEQTEPYLCDEELEQLRRWDFNISAENEKFLVAEGEDELIELAERFQKRFPDLLPDFYDNTIYYFKYTATQRTLKSAQSFATGLFGRHRIDEIIYPEALHKDPILRSPALNISENISSIS